MLLKKGCEFFLGAFLFFSQVPNSVADAPRIDLTSKHLGLKDYYVGRDKSLMEYFKTFHYRANASSNPCKGKFKSKCVKKDYSQIKSDQNTWAFFVVEELDKNIKEGYWYFKTTLTAPNVELPDTFEGALYYWPGFQSVIKQSDGTFKNNSGVIQPILTTYTSKGFPNCAPHSDYPPKTMWISGQYYAGIKGASKAEDCLGGSSMKVTPGDKIVTYIVYDKTKSTWYQFVINKTIVGNGMQDITNILDSLPNSGPQATKWHTKIQAVMNKWQNSENAVSFSHKFDPNIIQRWAYFVAESHFAPPSCVIENSCNVKGVWAVKNTYTFEDTVIYSPDYKQDMARSSKDQVSNYPDISIQYISDDKSDGAKVSIPESFNIETWVPVHYDID